MRGKDRIYVSTGVKQTLIEHYVGRATPGDTDYRGLGTYPIPILV